MVTGTTEESLKQIQIQLARLTEQIEYLHAESRRDAERWETVEDLAADLKLVGQAAFEGAVEELAALDPHTTFADATRLLRRLVENADNLDWTLQQLESVRDFTRDAAPIATFAFETLTERLEELDEQGVLEFVKEAWRIMQIILTSFTPEDVRLLGDNIVLILNTVKEMTQPEMMRMMHNLTSAWREAEAAPEALKTGTLALLRQMRDPQVRRGLAVTMQMLKTVAGNRELAAEVEQRTDSSPNGE